MIAAMQKEQMDELIELLQKYELSVAALYDTFADLMPSSRKAWSDCAKEERLHAKWISTLHGYLKSEKISFEQTRFTAQSTITAIHYIEKQIDTVKKTNPDLRKALGITIDIEKSLFESAFFRVFKLSGPKAASIQSQLIEATKIHLEKLAQWQAEEKNKAG
jgi:rubrerythrin